jgi:hypothetical protein
VLWKNEEIQKVFKGYDPRIYAASDHLLNTEYPSNLNPELKRKIENFVSDVLDVRLKNITVEEADKLFERCLVAKRDR